MAARISLRVKSGCLATSVKSHSEWSSSGEVLPPLGLASTLPVSLRRRHHRITELTPTSNTSATSRRDAPLSTASTARSRKSVEYGFGIDLAPRRINFSRFAWAKAVGNPPDSMPPGNALAGKRVFVDKVTGSKETRAEPFVAQCQNDNVRLVAGGWVHAFLDEAEAWPASKYKDQIDACSGAFNRLAQGYGYDTTYAGF